MSNLNLFQNQRAIEVNKEESNAAHTYAIINLQGLRMARKILSPSAFKLWTYLDQNQDGYQFALSRQAVMCDCGFSKNTYKKAFDELVDAGYLVETEAFRFKFFELPQVSPIQIEINKAKLNSELDELADMFGD